MSDCAQHWTEVASDQCLNCGLYSEDLRTVDLELTPGATGEIAQVCPSCLQTVADMILGPNAVSVQGGAADE